jgi:formylglycine-generating enzyme required for sulfatase activity
MRINAFNRKPKYGGELFLRLLLCAYAVSMAPVVYADPQDLPLPCPGSTTHRFPFETGDTVTEEIFAVPAVAGNIFWELAAISLHCTATNSPMGNPVSFACPNGLNIKLPAGAPDASVSSAQPVTLTSAPLNLAGTTTFSLTATLDDGMGSQTCQKFIEVDVRGQGPDPDLDPDLDPDMVVIPAGIFRMGDIQNRGVSEEKPVHEVRISKPFAIGRHEVTFEEYDRFAQATGRELPSDHGWGRGRRPVINVSWDDAVAYAEWLSRQTGKRYRLPSEAEWEYAARAGSENAYPWGNEIGNNRANCSGCGSSEGGKKTAPVGSFGANKFGIQDTAGNVWEWVQDCWHATYDNAPHIGVAWGGEDGGDCGWRVLRGGSWFADSWSLRSARRARTHTAIGFIKGGFRLAQDIE